MIWGCRGGPVSLARMTCGEIPMDAGLSAEDLVDNGHWERLHTGVHEGVR